MVKTLEGVRSMQESTPGFIPVIGFRLFVTLWKTLNKRKQIEQFMRRNFATIFAQIPLTRICKLSVFLENKLSF